MKLLFRPIGERVVSALSNRWARVGLALTLLGCAGSTIGCQSSSGDEPSVTQVEATQVGAVAQAITGISRPPGDEIILPVEPPADDDEGKAVTVTAAFNPNNLSAMIRTPFAATARNLPVIPGGCTSHPGDTNCCGPSHWRPWGGDWSCDFLYDNGLGTVDNALTCGKNAYLKVSPTMGLPNAATGAPAGVVPDKIRAVVSAQGYACASGVYAEGGLYQKYTIYATYRNVELELGWVVLAHLNQDTLVYKVGDSIADPMNTYVGKIYCPTYTSGCWGGVGHVHMELYTSSNDNGACYKVSAPASGLPSWGTNSVVAQLGQRDQGGGHPCLAPTREDSRSCSTWDMSLSDCNAHQWGTTQDCAYYVTSNKCRPRGTSNCEAGIASGCAANPQFCSAFDGNLAQCDAHGHQGTQDCAYYITSSRCRSRGTSNCEAGISASCSAQ